MKRIYKEVWLWVPLIFVMLASAVLADSIGFYEADSQHKWEQNSDRPINIQYSPSSSRHIVGIDAWVNYELGRFTYVSNSQPSVSADYMTSGMFDVSSVNSTYSEGKVQYAKGVATSGTGWTVAAPSYVYQLTFRVTSDAIPGGTTLSWEPDTCRLSTGPGVYVIHNGQGIGTINNQTITVTSSLAPQGFAGVGTATDATTGNKINVGWTTTGVTDITPFGITAISFNSNNVRYKVYRNTVNSGTGTLIYGGAYDLSGNSYANGLSTGIPGASPNDLIDCTNYYYRVEAVDNTINHNETSTSWGSAVKPHDYTACAAPSFATKNVSDIPGIGSQPNMFKYNGSGWDTISTFTGYVPENDRVTLYWNKGSASDYAGCMILQNPSINWSGVTPVSAADLASDANGTNYMPGNSINGATVVATGDVASTVVSSLTPGSEYYFKVYNYDRCSYDGNTNEQGRNYAAGSPITADAGIPPANATGVYGSKTADGITVHWTNPSESWFDGVLIVVKVGSYPTNPGDGIATYEARGLTGGAAGSYTFDTSACPSPLTTDYKVSIFTHNNTGTNKTLRRYSSGVQVTYDSTAPGPVSFLYALPETSTSLKLIWANPSDPDLNGVIVLRKPATSEFSTNSLSAGTSHSKDDIITGDEVVAFVGSGDHFSDTGLTAAQSYYYRAWAYDNAINYSSNYALTASIPGGGAGSVFAGPTTIVPGWNVVATGQQTSKTLNQSTLIINGNGALTGDEIYQLIPGTNNFNKATVNGLHQWIDEDLGIVATWEMAPDAGFFLKRNTGTPFTWEAR
jgi:hypothetical protein